MPDRTVHAFGDSGEVVRYDRAGKWYQEVPPEVTKGSPRRKALESIDAAVELAVWLVAHDHGSVNFGLTGGSTFDRMVRDRMGVTQ